MNDIQIHRYRPDGTRYVEFVVPAIAFHRFASVVTRFPILLHENIGREQTQVEVDNPFARQHATRTNANEGARIPRATLAPGNGILDNNGEPDVRVSELVGEGIKDLTDNVSNTATDGESGSSEVDPESMTIAEAVSVEENRSVATDESSTTGSNSGKDAAPLGHLEAPEP